MRKLLLILQTLLLSAAMSACSDDDDGNRPDSVFLYTTSIEMPATAGEKSVTLAATCHWTATSSESWVTVDPAQGEEGHVAVHAIVQANPGPEARTATVTFKAGTYTEALTVIQKAP